MQPLPTVDEFLAAPLGRYFVGARFLVWCWGPSLAGSCHWGQLGRDDIVELVRFLEWRTDDAGLSRFDMIADCERVTAIDPEGYQFVAERFPQALPRLRPIVRHFGFVHGGGFLGAVMSGVIPMAWNDAPWRAFEDAEAAFAWTQNPDAEAAFAEVAALIARSTGSSPTLEKLRRHLSARRGATTLQESARALGRSPRSLQRDLRSTGNHFRDELNRARIESARALLLDSDLKLEAIAQQIGFASLSQFSRVFRQLAGEPPSEFRARHKPSGSERP